MARARESCRTPSGRLSNALNRPTSRAPRGDPAPTIWIRYDEQPTSGETTMSTQLDLADIQGNTVVAYGRYGFPAARFVFFRVTSPRSEEHTSELQSHS